MTWVPPPICEHDEAFGRGLVCVCLPPTSLSPLSEAPLLLVLSRLGCSLVQELPLRTAGLWTER